MWHRKDNLFSGIYGERRVFDPELEEAIGHAIGKETRAFGGNLLPESALTFRTILDGAEARRLMVKSLLQSDRWAQRLYAEYRTRMSWRA